MKLKKYIDLIKESNDLSTHYLPTYVLRRYKPDYLIWFFNITIFNYR
jgi:hypothetical protein